MHYKKAKMTAKAKDAVATYAAVHNISVSDVRTDRPAVRGIYAELEGLGYQWVASKQSWAYTLPVGEKTPAVFTLAAEVEIADEIVYILVEGAKAAGYELRVKEFIYASNGQSNVKVFDFEVTL